ncbi:MAG: cobalamin B12-binding domain-containing protein [Candidatus Rokubacteria bacterium]|nr:cobalamin B12-binding domain-containing protein [Candidatus Rokubacteria bacterium]
MRPLRVLVAKPGLDGHDRGAKVVAQALRDAGMEVIYTGLKRTPEAIVAEAVQEDVDVVGLSILSGAHALLCERVVRGLKAAGGDRVKVAVGGTIPQADIPSLLEAGAWAVFPMGTPLPAIIQVFERLGRSADRADAC